jgi:spoIIIJ-associated protein
VSQEEEPVGESVAEREVSGPPSADVLEDAREDALDFLEGILDTMDLDADAAVEIEDQALSASVSGPDVGLLIGRRGQTLDALQELLRNVVQRQAQTRMRITLDIEGYRERRREVLQQQAKEMSQRALEDGEVELEPMSAFERKIIHDAVAEIEGVTSFSEGQEPRRRVVLRAE